jgi:hypothetical protein
MPLTSSSNQFEINLSELLGMPPRVESDEATGVELHQLYERWSTFYDEVRGGNQLPEHVHADARNPGTVRIEFGSANERDSVLVWRLADQRDPVINIRFVRLVQEATAKYKRVDCNLSVQASGVATVQQIEYDPVSDMIVPCLVEIKRAPNFNEVLLFDDALRQITTPNSSTVPKKQRLVSRLAGWLFNHLS